LTKSFAHSKSGAKKALAGVAAGTGIAVLAVNVLSWPWGEYQATTRASRGGAAGAIRVAIL
jgi:hypothetical protein